jgi:hypothetical protein
VRSLLNKAPGACIHNVGHLCTDDFVEPSENQLYSTGNGFGGHFMVDRGALWLGERTCDTMGTGWRWLRFCLLCEDFTGHWTAAMVRPHYSSIDRAVLYGINWVNKLYPSVVTSCFQPWQIGAALFGALLSRYKPEQA